MHDPRERRTLFVILQIVLASCAAVTPLACLLVTPPPSLPEECSPERTTSTPHPPLKPALGSAPRTAISLQHHSPTPSLIPLPLEHRGLSVLSAEELEYEDGSREVRCVLEGFLGQEDVFVSILLDFAGNTVSTTSASACRVSVLVTGHHSQSVQSALSSLGFTVGHISPCLDLGVRTLQVVIPRSANFLASLEVLSAALSGRGEILLSPPATLL